MKPTRTGMPTAGDRRATTAHTAPVDYHAAASSSAGGVPLVSARAENASPSAAAAARPPGLPSRSTFHLPRAIDLGRSDSASSTRTVPSPGPPSGEVDLSRRRVAASTNDDDDQPMEVATLPLLRRNRGVEPDAKSHHSPHSAPFTLTPAQAAFPQVSLVRWLVYVLGLTCVAYYFFLAPYMRDHLAAIQTLTTSSTGGLDRLLAADIPTPELTSDGIVRVIASTKRAAGVGQASRSIVPNTHLAATSAAPCSNCAFSFARPAARSPSSSFFITGVPNHGAGVGHQFIEWITGVIVARRLNLTYIHTPMLKQSSRWNAFLGLGEGEDTVEDLYATYGGVGEVHRREYPPNVEHYDATEWVAGTIDEIKQRTDILRLPLDEAKLTPAQRSLTPGIPLPILFELKWLAIPDHLLACEADINRTIRRKYCAARLRHPVRTDLYAGDRAKGKLILTWHLRCGDSCFDPYRTTSFESIVSTTTQLKQLYERLEPGRQLALHFFSQHPHNGTAQAHFAPLLDALRPLGMDMSTHWETKSAQVLHHLITSDVLFGALSGFSWLAFLHHNGVSLGAIPACSEPITYDKYTGRFDQEQFARSWNKYKHTRPKYDTWQDCLDMV